MQRNYDTTNGMPFVYFDVESMRKDPATQILTISYTERMALKSSDGVTHFLDSVPIRRFEIVLAQSDLLTEFPMVDLATGAHGAITSNYGTVMAGIIAGIRYHQEGRDALAG